MAKNFLFNMSEIDTSDPAFVRTPIGVIKDVTKVEDEVIATIDVGGLEYTVGIYGEPVYVAGENTVTGKSTTADEALEVANGIRDAARASGLYGPDAPAPSNETQRLILEVCARLEIEARNAQSTIVDIFFAPVRAFSSYMSRAGIYVDDMLAAMSRGDLPADAYTLMSAIVYLRIARKVKTSIVRSDIDHMIEQECREIGNLLIEKNRAYGNSALDPVRLFSKATPEEQILVRLDDKISRLMRGSAAGEDVEKDLLGYLVLLKVCRGMSK